MMERQSDLRCCVLACVHVACRLERVERSLEVATLLLKDSRNLLLPVRSLPETTLLLVKLDRTLK